MRVARVWSRFDAPVGEGEAATPRHAHTLLARTTPMPTTPTPGTMQDARLSLCLECESAPLSAPNCVPRFGLNFLF